MSKFKKDLEVGLEAEQEVKVILEGKGWKVENNTSKDLKTMRGYDLVASRNGEEVKVEVKNDLMAETTGNVAIEIRCLKCTQSPVWVYKLCGEFWGINITNLRNLNGRFVWGGDNTYSYMKLIPIIDFKEVAIKLI